MTGSRSSGAGRWLPVLPLLWGVGCGGPQSLGDAGAKCFRDDDCSPGLICVAPPTDGVNRVCSDDPTPLISNVQGPPVAMGGDAAMAGSAGATAGGGAAGAGAGGLAGMPTAGGGSGGSAAGTEMGGTESGGTNAGGTESGGTNAGGTESGGTDGGGTAGSNAGTDPGGTGGSVAGTASDGGAP